MEYKAEQKYLLESPRKIRPVSDLVRGMSVEKALLVLPFVKKKASLILIKVIKSAVANAKGIELKNLVFKEIQVGEGPRLKRGRPVSRGRWHPVKKRMSHIRVVLTTRETKLTKKSEAKTKVKPTANKTVVRKTTKNVAKN